MVEIRDLFEIYNPYIFTIEVIFTILALYIFIISSVTIANVGRTNPFYRIFLCAVFQN